MKIIEHIKELRAKEKDAPTLVAMSLSEEATKNAAHKAIDALLEVAEAAERMTRNYSGVYQDELAAYEALCDAVANLRKIQP